MVETATAFMVHHLAAARMAGARPTRAGSAQHNMAPYEAVSAKDGEVLLAAASQVLWERLCEVLGAKHLITDVDEFSTDAHPEALGTWCKVPRIGFSLPLSPLHLGSWRPRWSHGIPGLGEHTNEVLPEIEGVKTSPEWRQHE